MIEKTLIDAYREQVRQCLLRATKETGEPRLTESEVKELMEMFTDDDLAFGMPFNTPQEMADMLLEK